ncbi:MAG: glycosyltransferase family 2 protein [Planctomycetes bacterium]|nr:glycosyltransferase family 2 protein [Planctomycetota bacterium]
MTPAISVIVPIRNEAGTIAELTDRLPGLGTYAEAILVEGHSRDDSWQVACAQCARWPAGAVTVLRQPGRGKADAVRHGLAHARGRYGVILDADLGVDPELVPCFVAPLLDGRIGLVNGARIIQRRERSAMRPANAIGNAVFASAMSMAIGRRLQDALCGTKAFTLADWRRWSRITRRWQHRDPFGDFEILAGAALLGRRFLNLPVDYRARKYGSTNIDRWRDGARLASLVWLVAREIRFRP